jgi:APA family basic amino acid/polyamine antiporter
MENEKSKPVELVKGLGLLDASTIIIGSMMGSGIFIAPALMAGYIQTPGLIMLMWLIGGVLTICGGLSYGELAASMPKAGGQYVFLREAYSPLLGFLYGWTVFLVIQTGFIAAVAVAFAKYLGVFFPSLSETNILFSVGNFSVNSAQAVGILSIAFLTLINIFGVRLGALVQNIFTISKVGALALLIILAFAIGNGSWSNFTPVFTPKVNEALHMGFFAAFAVAMSKALFAYDAWNSVTFTAEEVKDPHRILPLALIVGTGITTLVYTGATMAYMYMVPIDQMAKVPDGRIATETAQLVLGSFGVGFIVIAIVISTFGCNNGLILSGARVYYAMAKDGLFIQSVNRIHPKYKTPVPALVYQGMWASLLTLSGTYSDLLTYTTFASLIFNTMTVVGIFILRKKLPNLERPYKVWGFPFVPIFYIVTSVAFIIYIFIGDVRNSGLGLIIVLAGIPFYWYWNRKSAKPIS